MPVLHVHLQRLGLLMHVGTADKASKTECMYYPPHRDDDISAEDTALVAADATGGYVSFTDSFKYLGSRVDCNLQDMHDVCSRITQVGGMCVRRAAGADLRVEALFIPNQEGGIRDASRHHTPLRRGVLVPH